LEEIKRKTRKSYIRERFCYSKAPRKNLRINVKKFNTLINIIVNEIVIGKKINKNTKNVKLT
jgi:hypothetical protein